jgi:hypothetical protein
VETLNDKLTKGTPFEMKPLRTIKIGNVKVSEKMPTLMIKDKPEIATRKATIEEVPNKEAPTLVADQQLISDTIIEEIPPLVIDSEDSNEEPLSAATLESEDKLIIAYIKENLSSAYLKRRTSYSLKIMITRNTTMAKIVQESDGSVHQSDRHGTLLDKTRGSELKRLYPNNSLMIKLTLIQKRRNLWTIFS